MNDEDEMDREAAQAHPCPYLLPAPRRSHRREPLRCGAEIGQRCRDPRNGHELERHAAHRPRLVLAGRAAKSTVPGIAPLDDEEEQLDQA